MIIIGSWKKVPVMFLLAFFLTAVFQPPVMGEFQSYDSGTDEWVFGDPSDFQPAVDVLTPGANATVGSCTSNSIGYYHIRTDPSWVQNTTAEYFQFQMAVNAVPDTNTTVELSVPDCYMGLSVEQQYPNGSWVSVDGNANYSLSVPYTFNGTSTPAADWGSLSFITPSGAYGTLKRVQLAMNGTALPSATLRVRVYYATEPAVKFDGINDYIRFTTSFTVVPYLQINTLIATYPNQGNYYDYWDVFRNNENVIRLEEHPSRILVPLARINNINYDLAPLNALYEMSNVTIVCSVDTNSRASLLNGVVVSNRSGWADLGTINTVSIGASPTPAEYTAAKLAMFKIFSNDVVMLINATSFSGGENTIVVNYGTAGNGTAYGNVQYKVWGNDPGEEGFRATYVGDPSDAGFMPNVYGAYLNISEGNVNIAPKVDEDTGFNWSHPAFGSVGHFSFTGNGSYVSAVTFNDTPTPSIVVPTYYLEGGYYSADVVRSAVGYSSPMVLSVDGGNLTHVAWISDDLLSLRVNGTTGSYSTTTVHIGANKYVWLCDSGGAPMQRITPSSLAEGYYYDSAGNVVVKVLHHSDVTFYIDFSRSAAASAVYTNLWGAVSLMSVVGILALAVGIIGIVVVGKADPSVAFGAIVVLLLAAIGALCTFTIITALGG